MTVTNKMVKGTTGEGKRKAKNLKLKRKETLVQVIMKMPIRKCRSDKSSFYFSKDIIIIIIISFTETR